MSHQRAKGAGSTQTYRSGEQGRVLGLGWEGLPISKRSEEKQRERVAILFQPS